MCVCVCVCMRACVLAFVCVRARAHCTCVLQTAFDKLVTDVDNLRSQINHVDQVVSLCNSLVVGPKVWSHRHIVRSV